MWHQTCCIRLPTSFNTVQHRPTMLDDVAIIWPVLISDININNQWGTDRWKLCWGTAQETLLHLFWECPITQAFWNSVELFFVSADLIPTSQVLTLCHCLGLKGDKNASLLNHCLLLGRYYIYSCKYKNVKPSLIEYLNQVRCNLKVEKHVSIVTGTQNAFQQKWHQILQSL